MVEKYFAIAFSCIGLGLVGIALALMFGAALTGISRNPAAEGKISGLSFIAAALIEAMGLFAFIIAMLLIFVVL